MNMANTYLGHEEPSEQLKRILNSRSDYQRINDIIESAEENDSVSFVLGGLSEKLSMLDAIKVFENRKHHSNSRTIKTIATFSVRCYAGGIEKIQAQLMRMWVKMGYRVILLTEEGISDRDYSYPDVVKRIVIPRLDDIELHMKALEDVIQEYGVDVFVNHCWLHRNVIWQIGLIKELGVKYVLYTHGNYSYNFIYDQDFLLSNQVYKMADAVIALSKTYAKYYQLCGCKSFFIRNPISDDLKQNRISALGDNKNVLYIGRISAEKRPLEVVEVFNTIYKKDSQTKLYIVGDGNPYIIDEMKSLVASYGLGDNVIFCGYKSEEQVSEYYINSNLMLMTSETEGFPTTITEAMAYGIPVVMYELPYLDISRDNDGIERVPQLDRGAMAKKALDILESHDVFMQKRDKMLSEFELLKSYDCEYYWKELLNYLQTGQCLTDEFLSDKLSEEEVCIIPGLLDSIYKGTEYRTSLMEKEYRIGQIILLPGRKIRRVLRFLKKQLCRA